MLYVRVRGLYISGPQVVQVVIGPSVQTLNESNPGLRVIGNGKVASDRHARDVREPRPCAPPLRNSIVAIKVLLSTIFNF